LEKNIFEAKFRRIETIIVSASAAK